MTDIATYPAGYEVFGRGTNGWRRGLLGAGSVNVVLRSAHGDTDSLYGASSTTAINTPRLVVRIAPRGCWQSKRVVRPADRWGAPFRSGRALPVLRSAGISVSHAFQERTLRRPLRQSHLGCLP
jgi:hypothetical protein